MSRFKVVFFYGGKEYYKESDSTDINEDKQEKEFPDILLLKYNSIVMMNILQSLRENKIFFKDSITVTNVTIYKDSEKIRSWGQLIISYSFVA